MKNIKRFIVKITMIILFFWKPTLRKKLTKALIHVSLFKIIKTVYEYKFKQPKHFKYYLSLTMCVKDERDYIVEWLEYYLLQGVDHFYIYNNNGTDDTEDIIKPYIDQGIVTWTEYPGLKKQALIYNDAVEKYKNETRWMGFIDVDEFIVPLKHKTLAQALKEYENYSQILMHWVCYGNSGHKKKTEGLVIERFTQHQKGISVATKAIVNPRAVLYADIHSHEVLGETVNEHRQKIYKKSYPTANIFQINHYPIKSEEEFANKKKRGRADLTDFYEEYYTMNEKLNEVEDKELMKNYIKAIKQNLQKKQIVF